MGAFREWRVDPDPTAAGLDPVEPRQIIHRAMPAQQGSPRFGLRRLLRRSRRDSKLKEGPDVAAALRFAVFFTHSGEHGEGKLPLGRLFEQNALGIDRSEEHTSELQSLRDL